MKNWKKLVRILLLVVIAIPTALIIGVQIPAVQTAIVGKVTDRLSEQLAAVAVVVGVGVVWVFLEAVGEFEQEVEEGEE